MRLTTFFLCLNFLGAYVASADLNSIAEYPLSRGYNPGTHGHRYRPKNRFDSRMYPQLTSRPVVGVLTVPTPSHLLGINGTSYIPASYVKWLEQSGLRVVPLVFNHPWPELQSLLFQLNGVAFPGGNVDFWVDEHLTRYAQAACNIFYTVKSFSIDDVYYPVWASGSGLHLLQQCASQQYTTVKDFSGSPPALKRLEDTPFTNSSRLFAYSSVGKAVWTSLSSRSITALYYHKGVAARQYKTNRNLTDTFEVVATVADNDEFSVVAIVEGRTEPFYGVLFHPERVVYEWNPRELSLHTKEAVQVSTYFSLFFASEARRCRFRFDSEERLSQLLIYNWAPQYVHRYQTLVYGF